MNIHNAFIQMQVKMLAPNNSTLNSPLIHIPIRQANSFQFNGAVAQ